jgi:type I restriction enzyme R subunit
MIHGHIAANLAVDRDDFEYAPFALEGGLGKVHQLFPEGLGPIMDSLNVALVA